MIFEAISVNEVKYFSLLMPFKELNNVSTSGSGASEFGHEIQIGLRILCGISVDCHFDHFKELLFDIKHLFRHP